MHSNIVPSMRPIQLRQPRLVRQFPFVLVLVVLEHATVGSQRLNGEVDAVLVHGGGKTLVPGLEDGDVVVEGDGEVDGSAIDYGL